MVCTHLDSIREVTPSANGCEDCLKTGDSWVHLRMCRQHGNVGCCDSSPDPWDWGYIDDEMLDFTGSPTLHLHTSSVAFWDPKLR
jgi:hypothetical protein